MHKPWVVALAGVLAVLVWQTLTVHFNYRGDWTGLYLAGTHFVTPADVAPPAFRHSGQGYDGQFYRLLAHDPLLHRVMPYLDDAQLRGRRILVSAAAWVLARSTQLPPDLTYVALVLAALGAGVFYTARLLPNSWWGLVFLILPGAIASWDRMLLDGVIASLFVAWLWHLRHGGASLLIAICTVAPLVRETGLVLPLALAAQQAAEKRWRDVALCALACLPAVSWWSYVAAVAPASKAEFLFARPWIGFVERLTQVRSGILGITDAIAFAGYAGCCALIIRRGNLPVAERVSVVSYAVLPLVLAHPTALEEPYAWARPTAPLWVWAAVQAATQHRGAWIAAPLAVSVGVLIAVVWQVAGVWRGLLALG